MTNPQILNDSDYKTNVEQIIKTYGDFTEADKPQFIDWINKIRNEKTLKDMDYS